MQSSKQRLPSIDRLRGLVIVLMALDHVRDFFTNVPYSPTDISHTNPALFFTRWVTHYCASTFIFLAGTSAYLASLRRTRPQLQWFLLTRGLWLAFLEFTVVLFVWMFNFAYPMGLVMQVIWATGISMCLLSALVVLPTAAIGAFGVLMIGLHDLLDGILPERFGSWAPLWNVVHVQGRVPFGMVIYPIVPWVGVMAAGYALGQVYTWEPKRRLRALLLLGTALCVAFVVVRGINVYGDPSPRTPQATLTLSLLSFLNVSKYPPSLDYVLMTLGPALLALAGLERFMPERNVLGEALETFGRAPLFAYVVHLALLHLLVGIVGLAYGFGYTMLTNIFMFYPKTWGFGLGGVYLAWLAVIAALYPLCRWFSQLKQRRSDWWLAYL